MYVKDLGCGLYKTICNESIALATEGNYGIRHVEIRRYEVREWIEVEEQERDQTT
jgi:hypothetical protein